MIVTAYATVRRRFNTAAILMAMFFAVSPALAPALASEPLRLLAYGDSLTAGYGLAPEDGFVRQLERRLVEDGLSVAVENAGVSGDTTAGGRARLAWSLGGAGIDAAILELGANDALRGIDPAETEANLRALLDGFAEAGIPVLLTGMAAPRNMGAEYVAAFDGIFPRLAAEYDVVFYPFFLDGVAVDPALNQADGIHPNPEGVAVIVERILPAVRAVLERAGDGA